MKFWLEGWEDGEPVKSCLESPDRWQTQAAERVVVELAANKVVTVQQQEKLFTHKAAGTLWCALCAAKQPRSLTAARLGVGACLWDGALVLTAFLAAQPPNTFAGKRCIELGAGVGLVGLALARLGAQVTLTDKPALLSLLRGNVAKNWLGERPPPRSDPAQLRGKADVAVLEWGSKDYVTTVAAMADDHFDFIVATDCAYIDPDGSTPDDNHFMIACAGLCHEKTRCFVTFEDRGTALRDRFLAAAHAKFAYVQQIPRSTLPQGYQQEHIDLWELRL